MTNKDPLKEVRELIALGEKAKAAKTRQNPVTQLDSRLSVAATNALPAIAELVSEVERLRASDLHTKSLDLLEETLGLKLTRAEEENQRLKEELKDTRHAWARSKKMSESELLRVKEKSITRLQGKGRELKEENERLRSALFGRWVFGDKPETDETNFLIIGNDGEVRSCGYINGTWYHYDSDSQKNGVKAYMPNPDKKLHDILQQGGKE